MNSPAQKLWSACLGRLQLEIPRSSFDTWLKSTSGLAIEDGRLTVVVPTTFAAEWLERRLMPAIQRAAAEVIGSDTRVVFLVASAAAAREHAVAPAPAAATPLPASREDAAEANAVVSPPRDSINPRYTFSSFVVGEGNQLAHAAATAVAAHPGDQYNPLFIYSSVGLGKTHLLHAIANEAASHDLHPVYVTSEQFTGDFIRSIRERTQDDFRAKYRSADVLLVDDIQFLEGKEQTQVGFFHTFNELHNANTQIVIACDRPPSAVQFLQDRLRSRFEGGLVADIQPPDVETRSAILQLKAERAHVRLDREVVNLLATTPVGSIRELEGFLNKVIALSLFMGKSISQDLVSSALSGLPFSPRRKTAMTPERTLEVVARHYEVSVEHLCTRSSDRKTTEAQRVAMYVLTSIARVSLDDAGKLLGDWNRRTVSNSLKAMQKRIADDQAFSNIVSSIITQL
ncbi:MAG: chromosomal replication initiator protein DnaA [Chloroflexi bacterium]|nr:chromosomal replication initiator protein DnaA [Chloroflexota bacterium]